MDFVVRKGDLLRELHYVQGVVEKRTTVPILSNLLLETTENRLHITATDLDVTIRCACEASIKVAGSLTVSARKLFDIIRLLPDADVHFKLSGQEWIRIACERSRFKIASLSKENFPDIPTADGETVALPGAALSHMISRCIFAITQEESRFTLNGALMLLRPGGVTFVTTDGHRLALISHEKPVGVESETRNLVPRKTLVELGKLTAGEDTEVEFGQGDNHLFFRVGDRLLISRILSGQFPNYEMVIPADNDQQVVLNTGDLSAALRRVSVMADEQSRAVRCQVKEGQLEISSNNVDFGEARESLPATFEGESLTICFNASYLLDFLGVLESDQVIMHLKNEETQGLFAPAEEDDYRYQYVVMPMKL